MHKQYIDKIIMSTDNKKMEELKQVLINAISYIGEIDEKTYCEIEDDLYEIAEGKVLNEEKAKEWVESMQPKANWTLNDIQNIKSRFETSLPILPAYIIMNMLYSDLGDVLGENPTDEVIKQYIRAAEDWYYDEDTAKTEDEKLYCYWKNIVN